MEIRTRVFLFFFLTTCLAVTACQPAAVQPETLIQTPILPSSEQLETAPTETAVPQATEIHGNILTSDSFGNGSSLCRAESNTSAFILACSDNELTISQSEDRRKVDITIIRELPLQTGSASIEVEALSTPAQGVKSDQNGYGFFVVNENGQFHALRMANQFFKFETWSMNGEVKIESKTNLAFSPLIKPAGQSNSLRMDCSPSGCDFFVNGGLVGRTLAGINGKANAVGLFAASSWNQKFGEVKFNNLHVYTLLENHLVTPPYQLEDTLSGSSTPFAGTGLSGAFNRYEADGFHFSPVIPYGYYSVKSGPALADVSVSVSVKMEIKPGVSGSRYAGVVCRSSQDGMVMAVIRADGTYTIYRDTPKHPFARLAEKASDAILPGMADNKLRLECIGDQINFYINETQVETLTDKRFGLRFGRAGLFTKAGGTPDPNAVVFSDFSITEVR
ncbi:MAG: hypothetical protein MUO42_00270 [Anaerolineaceae bacterium]|nr:hypothetical protein [Anaerolineaceae bacterium]